MGDAPIPNDYAFVDESVKAGKVYFYYIESMDVEGKRMRSDLVRVKVDGRAMRRFQPVGKSLKNLLIARCMKIL